MSILTATGSRRWRPVGGAGHEVALVPILAIAGGAVAIAGAAAPWISFFAGLHAITGLEGAHGRAVAALAAATITVGLIDAATGAARLRWVVGLLGFAILAIAAWSGISLLATLRELEADPLVVAQPGAGLPLVAVGGMLALATMFLPSGQAADRTARRHATWIRPATAGSLALAGLVHLALGPGHVAESTWIGGGMIGAGLAQLGLAALIARSSRRLPLAAAGVLNLALVAGYLAAVTVGLPGEPAHAESAAGDHTTGGHGAAVAAPGHGTFGHVETVTPLGATTAAVELAGAGLAVLVLAAGRVRRDPTPGKR